ncbi:MAG TPA: NAD(P)-dependent oxidoreductase [Chthoniobacterales bacterium]
MSQRTRKNVGIIGLGIIGSRVRDVLRRKNFHVFVWNRTPRPVPNFVGAPAELAEMCDTVQIFVSDDEALDHVVRQLSPGLTPRHVIIAHSTVAPHSMMAVAEIVERKGARFVEAPFTGSKEAAEKGELVYYVGGDEAALREVRPILQASSKQVLEIGTVGQATTIKLATNMVTAATVQAAAEALALVHANGVPLEKFLTAMQGNGSNSTTLNMKLPKMVRREFDAHFSVKHMLKDMQIAGRLGLSHHLELGISAAARDRLLEQLQNGHGDDDYSAIIRKFFPDVPTAAEDQSDLELFAQPQPVAPFSPSPAEPALPQAAFLSHNGPASPERETAPEAFPQHAMPSAFSGANPDGHGIDEPMLTEEEFSSPEMEDEPARPRGFLSRLLGR